MNKIERIEFYKYIGGEKKAILHRYNAYIRVLDGENKEHFFHELSKAIKFLLDQNYLINLNI